MNTRRSRPELEALALDMTAGLDAEALRELAVNLIESVLQTAESMDAIASTLDLPVVTIYAGELHADLWCAATWAHGVSAGWLKPAPDPAGVA